MKITIEIDAELDGEWLPEYEDEFIDKFDMPGVIVVGDENKDGGCAVLINTATWGWGIAP